MTRDRWLEVKDYVDRLESFANELLRLSQEKHEALVSADTSQIDRIMVSERRLLRLGASFLEMPEAVRELGLREACRQAPDGMREPLASACDRIAECFRQTRSIQESNMAFLRKALEYVAFMGRCLRSTASYGPPTT